MYLFLIQNKWNRIVCTKCLTFSLNTLVCCNTMLLDYNKYNLSFRQLSVHHHVPLIVKDEVNCFCRSGSPSAFVPSSQFLSFISLSSVTLATQRSPLTLNNRAKPLPLSVPQCGRLVMCVCVRIGRKVPCLLRLEVGGRTRSAASPVYRQGSGATFCLIDTSHLLSDPPQGAWRKNTHSLWFLQSKHTLSHTHMYSDAAFDYSWIVTACIGVGESWRASKRPLKIMEGEASRFASTLKRQSFYRCMDMT